MATPTGQRHIRKTQSMAAGTINHSRSVSPRPPTRFVITVGVLVAIWSAIFAGISVWFEVTDKFATGPHAADADALSVMNWYVTVVKLIGVAAAVLALRPPHRHIGPRTVGTVLWAAFSTVTIYVAGSVAQAGAILAGVAGAADSLDASSIGYVIAFLLAAAGFGILAVSYSRAWASASANSSSGSAERHLCWAASSSSCLRCSGP